MQNSTAVAARAVVMLACLALLPLFALFGSSTPELLVKLFGGSTKQKTLSSNEHLSDAPEFQSSAASPLIASGPSNLDTLVVPAHGTASSASAVATGYNLPVAGTNPTIPARQAFGPAANRGPSVSFPSDRPAFGQPGSTAEFSPKSRVPGNIPVESMQPLPGQHCEPSPSKGNGIAPAGISARPPASSGDTFVSIQERLRDLGAVYFRLESWGTGQPQFRFQCEMAVRGTPGLTRHFEAVNRDPLMAMHKVLVEAETWHESR